MHTHVRCDVVSLRAGRVAALPEACQAEIARRLSAHVLVAEVCGQRAVGCVLVSACIGVTRMHRLTREELLCIAKELGALEPLASEGVGFGHAGDWGPGADWW
jgi:hypothetical protein